MNDLLPVFVWSFVLIAAVVVGYVLVAWIKRRMQQSDEPASPGFTLADLRELHRSGQLSNEEYDRARAKLTSGMLGRGNIHKS